MSKTNTLTTSRSSRKTLIKANIAWDIIDYLFTLYNEIHVDVSFDIRFKGDLVLNYPVP